MTTSLRICASIALLFTSIAIGSQTALAQPNETGLRQAGAMASLSAGQTLTQLPDGRYLVLGGAKPSAAARVYDAAIDRFTPLASALAHARNQHTATLLPDGRVLILGGDTGAGVAPPEIFTPATGQFEAVADLGLLARSGHAATLISDGQLLILGGKGDRGQPVDTAELWNPRTNVVTAADRGPALERVGSTAQLLPDGSVLVTGGRSGDGKAAQDALQFDPARSVFRPLSLMEATALSVAAATSGELKVVASVPPADDTDFAPDGLVVLRFSQPVSVTTVQGDAVVLLGPGGVVSGKVVPSQDGLLAFLTPDKPLLPGADYALFVQRIAAAASGQVMELAGVSFTTRVLRPETSDRSADTATAAPTTGSTAAASAQAAVAKQASAIEPAGPPQRLEAARLDTDLDDELFVPTAANHGGRWRTARPLPKEIAKRLHALLAAKGPLAYEDGFKDRRRAGLVRAATRSGGLGGNGLSGQVFRLNDRPLSGAVVSIGGASTRTDGEGNFRLTGVPAGRHELFVNGGGSGGREYAQFVIGVDVVDGQITEVPPIYLPRIRSQDWIPITSPTPRDLVITHPNIPGMEIHIPKGAVLRERDGRIATRIALVPVPLDRIPFAFPENAPVYVSVQPGGMIVQGLSPGASRGIRVVYPNLSNEKPGALAEFWRYDPREKGWYVYGRGRATPDAKQIVPDPGIELYDSIGFMYTASNGAAPPGKASGVGPCAGGSGGQASQGCNEPALDPPPDCSGRGDPVSCATGLFLHSKTDISVSDIKSIGLTRNYRPEDSASRDFGIGASHGFGTYLYFPNLGSFQSMQIVQSQGTKVDYTRISAGTGYVDAVLEHASSGTPFYKSQISFVTGVYRWKATFKNGSVWEFLGGSGNPLLLVRDRFGNTLEITRNAGRIARITTPSGRFLDFTYDPSNRITEVEDNAGRSVTYEYYATGDTSPGAAPGYLKRVTWVVGGADPNVTEEYTYDAAGRMLTVKDRRSNTMVTNEYDGSGRVFRQTLADGAVYQYAYTTDAGGKITQTDVTNPRGYVERIAFNAASLITSRTLAHGNALAQTISYEYESGTNRQLATVDPRGRRTQLTYDTAGNVASVTRLHGTGDAVTESFEYTADYHELKKYTDPRGKITNLTYDTLGRLLQATDPLGNKTTYTYNTAGQVTSVTKGASGNTIVTALGYDLYDLRSLTQGGITTTYTTDAIGRTSAVTDGRGNVTYNEYDGLSRLRKVTDPHGKVTELKYDGNGNLLEVKDPGLVVTTYAYDPRDRLATRTDPFGKADTWVWDGNGNLASTTDRRGQQTTFAYDALDRRTLATYADTATTATSYSFSGVEAEAVVTDSIAGAVTRRLDGLDRLKYELSPQGRIDYAYDAASRRTSMQVQGEAAITYVWDDANRPTTITRAGHTITLGYDEADRRKSVSLPNSVEQRYLYGTSPTPTGIEYRKAGALTDSLADTWDADGRPVARGGTGTLPRTGLPNATTFTHDRNRLTALNGTAWAYDFQGNLTSDGTYTYLWDARNRLKEIKQGGTTVASFAYDALNRRSARTVSGTTTEYVHDGMTPIQEKVGANVTKLLTGPGIDDYLGRVEPTKTRYYLTDVLGSTVALTNESGDVATSYTYEPYGETSSSGEGSANPFQFTGRENDNTGLYYYRARYYHPVAKRFISEDPIGQVGGINPNLYVDGDPVSFADPLGLVLSSMHAFSRDVTMEQAIIAGQTGNAAAESGGYAALATGGAVAGGYGWFFGISSNVRYALAIGRALVKGALDDAALPPAQAPKPPIHCPAPKSSGGAPSPGSSPPRSPGTPFYP